MAKFDYKKWVTNNKYGRLNEQSTGSNDPNCYGCSNGNISTIPLSQIQNSWNSNWPNPNDSCGSSPQTGNWIQYYLSVSALNSALMTASGSGCGGSSSTGSAATGSGKYRIDAGGCLECPPQYANHPACIYTEPTCGQGHSTGSVTPSTPQSGTPDSQIKDSCEEFNTWDRREQKDFCRGCRRDESEPGCECCKGENTLQENNYFKYKNNMKESQLRRLIRKEIRSNIKEQRAEDPGLRPLDRNLLDKEYVESQIKGLRDEGSFMAWYDSIFGPYKAAGALIPTGREIILQLKRQHQREGLNEAIWGLIGAIAGAIIAVAKAAMTVDDMCCQFGWGCCWSNSTDNPPNPIINKVRNNYTLGESTKFDYKNWVTNNKYGRLDEQGKYDWERDPRGDWGRDPEIPVPITTCAQAGWSGECHAWEECVNGVGVGNALVFVNIFNNFGPEHYWNMFQHPQPGDTIITNTGIKLIYLGIAPNSTNVEQFNALWGQGSEPTSGTPSTCVQESWDCIEKGPHWKFGTKCVKRNHENGQFQSYPACIEYCNRNQDDSGEMDAIDYEDWSFNPMSGGTSPYQDLPSDDETNE